MRLKEPSEPRTAPLPSQEVLAALSAIGQALLAACGQLVRLQDGASDL